MPAPGLTQQFRVCGVHRARTRLTSNQEVSHVTYLLALIAVVVIAVLCWKAFGPERMSEPAPRAGRAKRVIGPDDDPDFLWRLSKQRRDGDGSSSSE